MKWLTEVNIELVSIIVGVCIVLVQNYLQHKSSLHQQKWQFKNKINIEIFEKLIGHIKAIESSGLDCVSALRAPNSDFISYLTWKEAGHDRQELLKNHRENIVKKYDKFSKDTLELIREIENNQYVSKSFKIYDMAIQSVSHDIRNYFYEYIENVCQYLDIGDGSVRLIRKKINEKIFSDLKILFNDLEEYFDDLQCYIYDIKIELQNTLMKDIFNNTVDKRDPFNKEKYIVISIENNNDIVRLEKHFLENTNWGKNWLEHKERARLD